jgi:cysteine protease ATG4
VGSLLFTCFRLIPFQALYTFPQSIGIAGGRPSSSYYFVGSQADNLFYLDPHHSRLAVPLRLPPQVAERERGVPIRQTTPERGSASPLGHNRSPTSPASSRTGSTTFSHRSPASPSPYRSNYRPAAHRQVAHMLDGTRRAPMGPHRSCLAQLVTPTWTMCKRTM